MLNIDQEFLKKSIKIHGERLKLIIAIEEMSELIKELCKSLRQELRYQDLVEEVADVLICMDMVKIIYDIKDDEYPQSKSIDVLLNSNEITSKLCATRSTGTVDISCIKSMSNLTNDLYTKIVGMNTERLSFLDKYYAVLVSLMFVRVKHHISDEELQAVIDYKNKRQAERDDAKTKEDKATA